MIIQWNPIWPQRHQPSHTTHTHTPIVYGYKIQWVSITVVHAHACMCVHSHAYTHTQHTHTHSHKSNISYQFFIWYSLEKRKVTEVLDHPVMKIFYICDCVHQPLENNNRKGSTHSHLIRFSGSDWHTTICVKANKKCKNSNRNTLVCVKVNKRDLTVQQTQLTLKRKTNIINSWGRDMIICVKANEWFNCQIHSYISKCHA